ncbi:hypothetical protein PVL29_022064 [Vitis rotundifolia]|uniref:S-adenosylmethionine-dependent methyltransferase n=1 Tax=Vitis rotundifolia TaxID=103349 RepID=A0AA38YUP1_VITRO|nr:hypothetical protein PVL29_022064 [Vitis rotundifolia]
MASEKEMRNIGEAHPMKSGDGLYSYSNNSYLQRDIINAAKQIVGEAIVESLDILKFSPSTTIRVADLGCSVGPNTFFAMENILEAIELKCQNQGLHSQIPEFQVFFNDHTSNDFNSLFSVLPPNRRYHSAGVPGSFYSRLFPNHSLHIVYSSFSIQWLSRVPKKVEDMSSPAWNKGRIYYVSAADEVVEAYSAQCAEDTARFLQARAQEIADGGLMILIFPARPDGIPHSQFGGNILFDMLGFCLMDMAKKARNMGIVSEEKVDMFNLPVYHMSDQELEAAVERNRCFSIERMERLRPISSTLQSLVSTRDRAQAISFHVRAAMEGLIKAHFDEEILDQLFDSFSKKLEQEYSLIESAGRSAPNLCAVLKRKTMNC